MNRVLLLTCGLLLALVGTVRGGLLTWPFQLVPWMGMFMLDNTYDVLDFSKEMALCPSEPAQESEWEEGHSRNDWPGIIFFRPDTHEDFEIYYDRKSESFLDEDIKKLVEIGFNPELPTVIYLHAFTQHPLNKWLRTVREDFVKLNPNQDQKINIMFFDWKEFAKLGYAGSAKWVPALGAILAKFLDKLVNKTNIDPIKLHLISFSLGNHICGIAGRESAYTIGRITALDPAGWCFSERYNHAYTRFGLKATDALQVDAYHFDSKFLGTRLPVGSVDIYMNGGTAQPGCSSGYTAMVNSALTMLKIRKGHSIGEGHSRAAVHSVYMVDQECHQIAYECHSYEAFQAGECGECDEENNQCFSTNIYGVQETWSNWRQPRVYDHYKKMFVNTDSHPPFCVQHYQIKVNLRGYNGPLEHEQEKNSRLAAAFISTKPQIILQDDQGEEWFATGAGMLEHEARPLVFTALAMNTNRDKIHKTVKARLVVTQAPRIKLEWLLTKGILSVEVNYMSHIDYEMRQKLSVKLCPQKMDEKDEGLLWLVEC